jgi:hypothetical protein
MEGWRGPRDGLVAAFPNLKLFYLCTFVFVVDLNAFSVAQKVRISVINWRVCRRQWLYPNWK